MGVIIGILVLLALVAFAVSRKEAPAEKPVAPLAELAVTGDAALDKLCREYWQKKDYDGAVTAILARIATMDDWNLTPEQAAQLRLMRRNELVCEAMSQAALDVDVDVELQGSDPADDGCRYCDEVKTMPLRAFLLAPDAMLCEDCPAKERKFFCDVNFRPSK